MNNKALHHLYLMPAIIAACIITMFACFAAPKASYAEALMEIQTSQEVQAEEPLEDAVDKWIPASTNVIKAELLSKNSIRITWNKVPKVDGYCVYRLVSAGNFKRIKTIKNASTLSCKDSGLKYGKTYTYVVRSYKNHAGNVYLSNFDAKGFSKKLKVKSKYKGGYKYFYDMDGNRINNAEPFLGKNPSYKIKVNMLKNVVTVYAKDGKRGYTIPVKAYLCSGNINNSLGTFSLGARYRYRVLFYNSYSQWTLVIHGDILFHTVPYKSYHNPNNLNVKEYNKLGTSASHGCIRMQCQAVKWLYDNCKYGTKVVFYKSNNPGALGKPKLEKLPSWHTWDPTDPTMKYKCKQHKCSHKPI